jgi:aspartokinase-like uncharacterized kinase
MGNRTRRLNESVARWSIVKLGGSLLAMDGLPTRLRQWLASRSAGWHVIVIGGGALADVVRDLHRRHHFGSDAAHRLAIEAMAFNTRMLSALLPEFPLTSRPPECRIRVPKPQALLLDVGKYLDEIEPTLPFDPLPASWDVTSDSIAARLATAWGAVELMLLKSSLPPQHATLKQLSDMGYVDRYFPTAAARLPVIRCVNLRDENFPGWVRE